MRTYTTNQYGRTVIIHLGKGEKLLESLTEEIKRLHLKMEFYYLQLVPSVRLLST